MRLQAAVLPPPDVQADLAASVASVPGGDRQLTFVPADQLHLRLASFGKVTLGDAEALRTTLGREFAHWSPMTLRFQGGTALEPLGDASGWAKVAGDVDRLTEVADLTARVVKRLGFLVDRRLPRTLVRVGRITPATTESYLQRLIDRLEEYEGPQWSCDDVALLRLHDAPPGAPSIFEVFDRLELGEQIHRGTHRKTPGE